MPRTALIALLLCAAAPAMAADPTPCTAPADLAATPYAGWTAADGEALAIGTPVTLPLPNGAATRTLTIESAGRYGVAASGKLWIDVAREGAVQSSVDHGHGPACSGIRKIVWFDLAAGNYELALSKAEATSVRLMLVRAP